MSKERILVTLDRDLLKRIDRFFKDKGYIPNRSAFIQKACENHLLIKGGLTALRKIEE